MKKQELIHLHGLLAQLGEYYEAQSGDTIDRDAYHEVDVRPTSIHKSKTQHKEAVFALAKDTTAAMESETERPVSATAD